MVPVLQRIVRLLRGQWPRIAIEGRADSGFEVPTLYACWGTEAVTVTIGPIPRARLQPEAAPFLAQAQQQTETGQKVQLLGECQDQAGTWNQP